MDDLVKELTRMGFYETAFFHNGGINPELTFDENMVLTHLMFREIYRVKPAS